MQKKKQIMKNKLLLALALLNPKGGGHSFSNHVFFICFYPLLYAYKFSAPVAWQRQGTAKLRTTIKRVLSLVFPPQGTLIPFPPQVPFGLKQWGEGIPYVEKGWKKKLKI